MARVLTLSERSLAAAVHELLSSLDWQAVVSEACVVSSSLLMCHLGQMFKHTVKVSDMALGQATAPVQFPRWSQGLQYCLPKEPISDAVA